MGVGQSTYTKTVVTILGRRYAIEKGHKHKIKLQSSQGYMYEIWKLRVSGGNTESQITNGHDRDGRVDYGETIKQLCRETLEV